MASTIAPAIGSAASRLFKLASPILKSSGNFASIFFTGIDGRRAVFDEHHAADIGLVLDERRDDLEDELGAS